MRRSAKSAMRSISKFAKLAAKVDEELKAQPMGGGLPYKGDVDSEEEQMAHDLRPECCRYCKLYVGKERVEMSEHLKLRHPEKVTCPTCSEVCPSEFFLTRHLKQHTAEVVEKKRLHVPRLQIKRSNGRMARVYRCPDCDKLVSCIKRHRIVAHGNGEYPFACEECEYRFPVASDLRSHVRRKHRGEFASLCAECGKGFTCRSALEDHERKHRGERSFVCDACGRGFFSKVNLTSHLRTHEASLELECDLCGKCYPSATHLRSHRMMHFEENRRFACNFCPQKFFKRGILDYHIKLKHTLERPFECNTCGKTFIMRGQMEEHTRRHLGERSHDCMHCSKNYYKKRNLQRHILSAHKHLVETWLCDECPREYLKQRSLIDHKLQAHPTVAEMVRKKAEAAAAAEMLQKMPQQENEQEPRVVVEILPQPEAQNDLLPMEFKDLFAL